MKEKGEGKEELLHIDIYIVNDQVTLLSMDSIGGCSFNN